MLRLFEFEFDITNLEEKGNWKNDGAVVITVASQQGGSLVQNLRLDGDSCAGFLHSIPTDQTHKGYRI